MGFMDWVNRNFNPTHPNNNPYAGVEQNNFNLPGFAQRDQFAQQQMQGASGREAFTASESPFRDAQRQSLDNLQRQYSDDGNSFALAQQAPQQAAAAAQQRSLMASASPANAAMMARVGSQNIGRANQAIAGNAMMGRIAERQGLANTLGQMTGMARAQDQAHSQFNAGMQQQNRSQNDQAAQGWYGGATQNAGMQQNGMMGYENNRMGRFGAVAGQPTAAERAVAGTVGAVQTAGPMIASALSDERAKKNVGDGGKEADSFMDGIRAKKYEYKPGLNENGKTSGYSFRDAQGQTHFVDHPAGAESGGTQRPVNPDGSFGAAQPASRPVPLTTPGYPYNMNDAGGQSMYNEALKVHGTGNPGERLGVMAQDVQKSPMGAAIVKGGGETLRTIENATGPILASLARLNERLKSVETKKPGNAVEPLASPVIKKPEAPRPAPKRLLPGELAK